MRASVCRRALDAALEEGGALDPLLGADADDVSAWLAGGADGAAGRFTITLRSNDPDDLTLREARLLGQADAVVAGPSVPSAVLARVRADAARLAPGEVEPEGGIVVVIGGSLKSPSE